MGDEVMVAKFHIFQLHRLFEIREVSRGQLWNQGNVWIGFRHFGKKLITLIGMVRIRIDKTKRFL